MTADIPKKTVEEYQDIIARLSRKEKVSDEEKQALKALAENALSEMEKVLE